MDQRLKEIKFFVEDLIRLNNRCCVEQMRMEILGNLISSRENSFLKFLWKIKLSFISGCQSVRIKKLTRLNNEFITRAKTEDWFSVPGYKEYIDSVKDRLAKI